MHPAWLPRPIKLLLMYVNGYQGDRGYNVWGWLCAIHTYSRALAVQGINELARACKALKAGLGCNVTKVSRTLRRKKEKRETLENGAGFSHYVLESCTAIHLFVSGLRTAASQRLGYLNNGTHLLLWMFSQLKFMYISYPRQQITRFEYNQIIRLGLHLYFTPKQNLTLQGWTNHKVIN